MLQTPADKSYQNQILDHANGVRVASVVWGETSCDDLFTRGIETLRTEINRLQELRAALPREMPYQAARHLAEQIRRPWSFYEKHYPTDVGNIGNVAVVLEARINQLELAISDIQALLRVLPNVLSPEVNRILTAMAHIVKV